MPRTRRTFLHTSAGALAAQALPAQTRPNIVLFLADDLGYGDLSSYGCQDINSPNIDGIGTQGVRFRQFYSNAPECTPARTALLTGRYQQRVGGLECAIGVGNVGRYDEAEWLASRGELGLPASEQTIGQTLKAAGYDTAIFGKWHLGYEPKFDPKFHGFDESLIILGGNADYFTHREDNQQLTLRANGKRAERQGYITDLIASEARTWLKRSRSRPFFLYVPFTAPHAPIQDPDGFDAQTGTAPRKEGHRPTFARMVERMDRGVGEVLSALEQSGQAQNTIVLFLSDNGGDRNGNNGPWRGRKSSMWEGGIRVPCLMRWPGVIDPGTETDQVALDMDLTATLLSACAPRGHKLDGIDLRPILSGSKPATERTVFWRYKRGENIRKAVRDRSLKLVIDNRQEELHDVAADPKETVDLLSKRPHDAARLRALLAAWEREVQAPRLKDFPKAR